MTLSSFSALTLLVGSFDLYKPVPDMTYDVFGETLNLALSTYLNMVHTRLKCVTSMDWGSNIGLAE